jgi:hypothetical protein
MADIAEVTRTYGGLEGRRIKAGHRFAVGKAIDGLDQISRSRFQQLKDAGLAREWDPSGTAPAPRQPAPGVARQTVVHKPLNQSRTAAKAAAKNSARPAEPRPLTNPALGGPASAVKLALSSPEVRASVESNLALRGRRKSPASPSTTPTKSVPGPESSTLATGPGGATTTGQKNSPA